MDFLALSSHTNPPFLGPQAPLAASTSLAVTTTSSSSTEDSLVEGESSKVEGEAAQTAAQTLATSDGLVKQDEGEGEETVEAKVEPGQVIGGRTLPAFMLKEETAILEERIVRLLDSFER